MFAIDLNNGAQNMFTFLLLGTVVKFAALGLLRRKRQKKFECIGRVHSLVTYPVKSGVGINVTEAKAGVLGLEYKGTRDRHWMVTKGGYMLSSKAQNRLVLISCTPQGHGDLQLDAPGMPSLVLEMDKQKNVSTCSMYNIEMEVYDCGEEAATWLNTFLKSPGHRLVHSPPHLTKRDAINTKVPWKNNAKEGDLVAFGYMSSYMVASASSLHDLNQRLDSPVTMSHFRPNIVIEGAPPFDEDSWVEMSIGDSIHLRKVDFCRRCMIININPATGESRKDKQPLQKLKSYRCRSPYGENPLFGVYCALEVKGDIKIGDSVSVIRQPWHRTLQHLDD